ncbi:MAG TPA: 3'-5' exonuclease, partial [Arenicellales bacterium]|nr:3'-5' exonuclease [Arenicellales bacterium]
FRQAEVGVFLEVWENGLGAVPVQPLRLSSNFRSAPAVVNWVNDTFSRCLPARPDIHSGAVAYAPSTPQRGGDHEGRVQVHPFVDCPEPQWAARLAELIGEALGRSDEVAVLVRARSHLAPLLPAFQARGIPYSGMDIAALIDEPVVRDLHSLTRALLHPGDRLAWLAVLRAPWCGLRLEDLLALPAARDTPVLWNALEDPQVLARLSPDGRARVARFCRALSGAAAQRGRMLLSRCVRWAWVELGGPALMRSGDHDHVHAYLQLLAAYQSGMNLTDEQAFDAALRGHWAHVEARPGAVQLMTVHRAKGLEFDEVFVPALERPTRGDDKRLLLWEETTAGGLLLATLSARGEPDDPHYRFLRALQAEKAANEDDRLLYVACTRARERLHLLGNLARRDGETLPPRRGSLLQRIWPSVGERFLEACPAAPEDAGDQGETGVTQPALRRLPSGWAPPPCPDSLPAAKPLALDEARVEFSWVGETARHVGVLVHELMQRIAAGDAAQWRPGRIDALHEDWRERLRHLGVPSRELEGAVRRTADAIRNVLADETAAWLLAAHEQAGNELELSVADNGRIRRLRIDRTFVDDEGVRWIVDYKTSAHEGGALDAFLDEEVRRYRDKLEFYARALRKLESRPIRLGLYFPLLRGWREWPYEG